MHVLYLHQAWPNYGLDVLNITMHTEVVIHSMNAYVWCWSKICGSALPDFLDHPVKESRWRVSIGSETRPVYVQRIYVPSIWVWD